MISRASSLYRTLRLVRNVAVIAVKGLREVPRTSFIHPTSTVCRDLQTGPYVFIGARCMIGPAVRIGAYTMLASQVAVVGDDHNCDDPTVPIQFSGRPSQHRTEIGADVWIGHGAILRRGVRIGDGAIIGAGSVVTHDVPPREVWVGVPARRLRSRFSDAADAALHAATLSRPAPTPIFAEAQQVQ